MYSVWKTDSTEIHSLQVKLIFQLNNTIVYETVVHVCVYFAWVAIVYENITSNVVGACFNSGCDMPIMLISIDCHVTYTI